MVLKDHADLLDSGWIMLPENEAFDANLALQEKREKSGKSLSFPQAFEAYHTKAEADRIAKDVHCADLEGWHLELECVRDEAAIGFPRGGFSNETNNGTNGDGLGVAALDMNVNAGNAGGYVDAVDLVSKGNDEDYSPLADDVDYDEYDSDYEVNGDLGWSAKRKKTATKKGERKGRPCHMSQPIYVSKCEEQKKFATKKSKSDSADNNNLGISATSEYESGENRKSPPELNQAPHVCVGGGLVGESVISKDKGQCQAMQTSPYE